MAWIDILNSIGRNADMNQSELGIADTLFQGGDYDQLVKKYLKDSGASRNMSPYYYQALLQGAKRLAIQGMLEDYAGGATGDTAVQSKNFGQHLSDLMSTPGGLGWKRPEETMNLYSQAIANIQSWGDAPEGSQARARYDEFYSTDPRVSTAAMNRLKAMAMVAMGPGYGGAFNSAFQNALTENFDNSATWLGTDNPDDQRSFWGRLSNVFGGLSGQTPPSARSNTPNIFSPSKMSSQPTSPNITSPAGPANSPGGSADAGATNRTPVSTPTPTVPTNQVSTPAEAEALYNKSENQGKNYEGVVLRIGSTNYISTKGQDGSWHLVPEGDYHGPLNASYNQASYFSSGSQPVGASSSATNSNFDNGIQSPSGAGPATVTPSPLIPGMYTQPEGETAASMSRSYVPPAEQTTPSVTKTLSTQEQQLARAYPTVYEMYRQSGSTESFLSWLTHEYPSIARSYAQPQQSSQYERQPVMGSGSINTSLPRRSLGVR
jgi:hypothetical protein